MRVYAANFDEASVEKSSMSPYMKQQAIDFSKKILDHPFLVSCREGNVPFRALMHFLVQHGKYSAYFTRYLCALISQLKNGADVLKLAENLAEELGFGHDDVNVPHSQIYTDLLTRFDISIAEHAAFPETESQIQTVFMLCRQPEGIAGLGALCLGAEAIVPSLYSAIIEGFRHHDVSEEDLDFFRIHIECDDGHAETMYRILGDLTANSPEKELCAIQSAEIAINARLRVYDAILRFSNVT
ncbi:MULTISPECIES: TenA family transcriptional regulator [Paraburkholderia]|uniref:TenA family transcriptional regulator n=1 Tax=Paraburkholderia TaxID=1822464 RepID=UPI00224F913C|nr:MULTISPECIES: iron-containing redox enzyme family protein [Paraburkholderia]MCX4165037.1 iron-containing redox enzyme family protein [Paraburkholderia megapolitana]MDN7160530.1 iron-containing redox enzyme family protein [Paraburkholderia sp. CHISQ3]MDQ6497577.1 iron-containing redox enzyme family protein [Paraburkholderia megapolitana]